MPKHIASKRISDISAVKKIKVHYRIVIENSIDDLYAFFDGHANTLPAFEAKLLGKEEITADDVMAMFEEEALQQVMPLKAALNEWGLDDKNEGNVDFIVSLEPFGTQDVI
jgi:hypothetical protein